MVMLAEDGPSKTFAAPAGPYGVTLPSVSRLLEVLEDAVPVSRSRDSRRRRARRVSDAFDLMAGSLGPHRRIS